jgi:hypothetical protein
MSNNMLNDIEHAIYEMSIRGHKNVVVKFSPEGHARASAERVAKCFFRAHESTFAGYPYVIVPGQVESFKVELSDD